MKWNPDESETGESAINSGMIGGLNSLLYLLRFAIRKSIDTFFLLEAGIRFLKILKTVLYIENKVLEGRK